MLVSDFVTPAWFKPVQFPIGPYDRQEIIQKPLGLLRGGHLQFLELGSGAGWQQETEQREPLARLRARPGSRRERRRVGHHAWQRCKVIEKPKSSRS